MQVNMCRIRSSTPRNLFDIKLLLENEGITNGIRKAFVVYLASHSRPIHELLNPNLLDITLPYQNEFVGMTNENITLKELISARDQLILNLKSNLSEKERMFLLSLKNMEPDWPLTGIKNLDQFPALQWKLMNLKKMLKEKHVESLDKLKRVLEL